MNRAAWPIATALLFEVLALGGGALSAVIMVLGKAADHFGGTGLWRNLLPFAATVLTLALLLALLLWGWLHSRRFLVRRLGPLGGATAAIAIGIGTMASLAGSGFDTELTHLRQLVGGVEEAERTTIAHQVFAHYRRSDLGQTRKLFERAKPYVPAIQDAATDADLPLELLIGLAATESSFLPRDSVDGGHGLFQITAIPKRVEDQLRERLKTPVIRLDDPKQNASLAAATLRSYLAAMNGDLFLGLLAYNIGPKNGGLQSIMRQYGARDFATIQPYLQTLPRDYPIRVLSAALAYRLWNRYGTLPPYAESDNAKRIQAIGIPGLAEVD